MRPRLAFETGDAAFSEPPSYLLLSPYTLGLCARPRVVASLKQDVRARLFVGLAALALVFGTTRIALATGQHTGRDLWDDENWGEATNTYRFEDTLEDHGEWRARVNGGIDNIDAALSGNWAGLHFNPDTVTYSGVHWTYSDFVYSGGDSNNSNFCQNPPTGADGYVGWDNFSGSGAAITITCDTNDNGLIEDFGILFNKPWDEYGWNSDTANDIGLWEIDAVATHEAYHAHGALFGPEDGHWDPSDIGCTGGLYSSLETMCLSSFVFGTAHDHEMESLEHSDLAELYETGNYD